VEGGQGAQGVETPGEKVFAGQRVQEVWPEREVNEPGGQGMGVGEEGTQ